MPSICRSPLDRGIREDGVGHVVGETQDGQASGGSVEPVVEFAVQRQPGHRIALLTHGLDQFLGAGEILGLKRRDGVMREGLLQSVSISLIDL